jgi:stage III sporulation protein AH
MAVGKRQLVLAALVVALGAAVYLNWAFFGNGTQLPATQAVTSGVSNRQYGQTLQVNASTSSGAKSSSKKSSSNVSKASSATSAAATATSDDYFSQARLDREKAQDEAKETIAKVFVNSNSDNTMKQEAVTKTASLMQNLIREADIENLVKAKGFQDCIVTLDNGQCSVVVKTKANSENDAAVIQDIVAGQTGLSYDKIKIIERS